MQVKIKRLNMNATLPIYASKGSACFDLHSALDEIVVLLGGATLTIPCGLAFEVPKGFAMMIYSRSGHGFNNDARLANCVGCIDSDYRGEVMVKLISDAGQLDEGLTICPGDRIAQAMIVPVPAISWLVVPELSDSERGTGGFGSTGK